MRRLFALAAAAIALGLTPAEAAFKQYINHPLGFAVDFPAAPKVAKGTYKASVAGTRKTTEYSVTDDNIVYKITIIDFSDRIAEGSNLMEEAAFITQENDKVLLMDFARVQTGKNAIYGRRMTVELPKNGGRESASLFFTKNKLYWLEATVLPAHGDPGDPAAGRFVDSLIFDLADIDPMAVELPAPPK